MAKISTQAKIILKLLGEGANDSDHMQALRTTGFWGKKGAGCLFLARDTARLCIAHRSRKVQEPNTWGTWGGAVDQHEAPETAVLREIQEESGKMLTKDDLVLCYTFRHASGFTYYNYVAHVPNEFQPVLDWETQGFRWVDFGEWPTPLHPGMKSWLSDSEGSSLLMKTVLNVVKASLSQMK